MTSIKSKNKIEIIVYFEQKLVPTNLKNILKQNIEVLKALKGHNLFYNFFIFFVYKIFSRSLQFFKMKILWKKF